ncbi:hypothetical protein PMKS-003159 [Pichia membranifaciens]|uniref:Mif2/CENP-C cupin domain-containing protein n=1 Tax=Pichia membranifaciens TaxID=4926 RepID=A0A1Q2YJC7_9ASCO|nr:hypothetical protein PMKS-003159 [Pichia membranifaciens]
MPRSKRSKLVTLAQTDRKGKENKVRIFDEIREGLDSFRYTYVLGLDDVRTPASQLTEKLEEVEEQEDDEPQKLEKKTDNNSEKAKPEASSADNAGIDRDSDTDSDMDLEEVIKRAEDIGTPIRIPRRTLTSITGSPASNNNTVLSNKPLLTHTANSSKLTKKIALNKNTRNSKFEPQDIMNANPEPEHAENGIGVLNVVIEEDEPVPVDDVVVETESQASQASPVGKLSDIRLFSEPLHRKLEADAQAVDPVSEEPTEKILFSQPDHNDEVIEEKESSPLLTQVISQPVTSPKKNEGITEEAENAENNGDADKTSEDIQEAESHSDDKADKPKPRSRAKPRLQTKKEKPVTTTDIVEFIISKDDHNISMQDRKANNLLKRKAAVKSYSTSELIDSASESESTNDRLPVNDSKLTIARKSKSMDTVSRTPVKSTRTNSKVSKMLVPAKPKAASRQNSKPKSAQPETPIRRSTRTRVAPVASWKNEKILYKTEKVNGVIVKSVDNVLHRPDNESAHAALKSRQRKNKNASEETAGPTPTIKSKALKSSSFANDKETETVKPIEELKKKRGRKPKVPEKPSEAKGVQKPRTESSKHAEARNIKVHDKKSADSKPTKRTPKRKSSLPENNVTKARSRLKKQKLSTSNEENPVDNENTSMELPPTGWQGTGDGSLALSIFEGPGTEKQVERTVAYAPGSYKNVTIIKSDDEYFKVGTLFDQDCEFCGGGIIELPSGARKAVKSNHDTYFIFYVISGEVEVTLSRNTFTVTEGCSFEIPMGNYYQFVNTGGAMAKMMFVQAKYIVIGENSSSDSDENDNRSDNSDDGNEGSETA